MKRLTIEVPSVEVKSVNEQTGWLYVCPNYRAEFCMLKGLGDSITCPGCKSRINGSNTRCKICES
jgi:hypothetical protein